MDLRQLGWSLAEVDVQGEGCVPIIWAPAVDDAYWRESMSFTRSEDRRLTVVAGVNCPEARTRLLAAGFGEVVNDAIRLEELEARARRLADMAGWVPRRRSVATLILDLMVREASYLGKPLSLHPREFALLWQLADTPDEAVSKQTLLHDIWRLGFMPESNRIAVQMSRLRSKLAAAGLKGLVATVPEGYLFRSAVLASAGPPAWSRRNGSGVIGLAAAL